MMGCGGYWHTMGQKSALVGQNPYSSGDAFQKFEVFGSRVVTGELEHCFDGIELDIDNLQLI